MNSCRHFNIVSMFGIQIEQVNEVEKQYSIIMEYFCNGNLYDFLHKNSNRDNNLPNAGNDWMIRAKIAVDICRGLNYLHSILIYLAGSVHPDLFLSIILSYVILYFLEHLFDSTVNVL